MKNLQRFLERNGTDDLILAAVIAVLVYAVLYAIRRIAARRFARREEYRAGPWKNLLAGTVAATHGLMLFGVALLAGLNNLELPSRQETLVERGFALILLVQIGLWGRRAIREWRRLQLQRCEENERGAAVMNYGVITFLTEAALWVLVLLMALDNLSVNITTLIASLGIGGIAVALAVQNILGDLFASLSIALDKPFVAGDFIVVDTMMGTVKHVGLKTTRIQSLSGEELILSNADLLKSRIRNYKRMAERRVAFELRLVLDTPPEKLRRAREIILDAVRAQPGTRLDRAHFKTIGAGSLDFEVVYYVLTPDFAQYMDIQQAINLVLVERLAAEGIRFAPSQFLHVATDPAA
jgi:small-conductance mechanosensitive channel